MAISLATRALLLVILPRIGIAARVQFDVVEHALGAFECPKECWECCAAPWAQGWGWVGSWGTSGEQFKCILRSKKKLPPGRECEKPDVRANDPDSVKTYCAFSPGEDSERPAEQCVTQGAVSKWAEWLWQKKGEVFGLANGNVMEMASIIRKVRTIGSKEDAVLPLTQLSSIHPVDEPGAIVKTAGRARSAQAARHVLDKEPYTLSKRIIGSYPGLKDFQSVTGFYVVKVGEAGWHNEEAGAARGRGAETEDEYVTFEGNGRCVALLWAFPEGDELREKLKIEVTEFVIEDAEDRKEIVERIRALQKAMGSREFAAIRPPSLEEEKVTPWANGVKAELEILKANAANASSSKP